MNKQERFKIILADDHLVLRDSLAQLVNSFDEFTVIERAAHGKDVMKALEQGLVPDILILDLNMPVMDGYETAHLLKLKYPQVKIVALTMYDSEIPLIRLLKDDVRGFLKKDIGPQELHRALLIVANDGYYYSHNIAAKLVNVFQKTSYTNSSLDKAVLSPLEITFLQLASSDLTYKEIAFELNLSPSTVDNYRESLFEKLSVKSRVSLAMYAIKNGIVAF